MLPTKDLQLAILGFAGLGECPLPFFVPEDFQTSFTPADSLNVGQKFHAPKYSAQRNPPVHLTNFTV